jgi:hypothetical protein
MEARNELQRLESIVSRDISLFMEMKCAVNYDLLEDFKQAMWEETEQIKNSIIMTVCSVPRKAELKRYIQYHQQNMVTLSSQLIKYSPPERITRESRTTDISLLCHYIYKSLEDLLNFVERHFTGYFNPDAWVPASYRLIAAQEICQNLERLKSKLKKLRTEQKLMTIIFEPYTEFLEKPTEETTYRKVKFLKVMKKELTHMVDVVNKTDDVNETIRKLLTKINFNSLAFFTYCTNHIASQVNASKSQSGKLNKLAFCLKEMNQVVDKPGLIYDSRYRPLKEQIGTWIVEELKFQERTPQLEIGFPEATNAVSTDTRMQLDLSVTQVACLVRGFVEEGIIKNRNLSELIRLIVSIIKTKHSEKISPDSFRMKYYNIEDSARMVVAARLRAIAEYLVKN